MSSGSFFCVRCLACWWESILEDSAEIFRSAFSALPLFQRVSVGPFLSAQGAAFLNFRALRARGTIYSHISPKWLISPWYSHWKDENRKHARRSGALRNQWTLPNSAQKYHILSRETVQTLRRIRFYHKNFFQAKEGARGYKFKDYIGKYLSML